MKMQQTMLQSQLTWLTDMPKSVAAGQCERIDTDENGASTLSRNRTKPSPWHARDEPKQDLTYGKKRPETRERRTKPSRPANRLLYSLYWTRGFSIVADKDDVSAPLATCWSAFPFPEQTRFNNQSGPARFVYPARFENLTEPDTRCLSLQLERPHVLVLVCTPLLPPLLLSLVPLLFLLLLLRLAHHRPCSRCARLRPLLCLFCIRVLVPERRWCAVIRVWIRWLHYLWLWFWRSCGLLRLSSGRTCTPRRNIQRIRSLRSLSSYLSDTSTAVHDTHSPNARHDPLLLLPLSNPLLSLLVQSPHKPLHVPFVTQPILVLLPRWLVIRNVDVAILAVVPFVRHPVFRHGGS